MHEVLVNRLGGLSLPRKSVVRLTDRPDMTLDVYRGRKTTIQQYNSGRLPPFREATAISTSSRRIDCKLLPGTTAVQYCVVTKLSCLYSSEQYMYAVHLLRISCSLVKYLPNLSWISEDLPCFSQVRAFTN